jgi:hypothetical protein
MRHRTKLLILLPILVALGAAGAYAWFTATGSGNASGSVGTLNAPTGVSAAATGSSVHVTWNDSTLGDGVTPASGYYVTRIKNSDSSTANACGTSPSSLTSSTATSCDDTSVPDGTYHYTVTAVYHSWTATSDASNDVTVAGDTNAPTVLSINRHTDSPTNASSVQWDVTFSESVTGVDSSDFALAGAGATGASISGVSGSSSSYAVTVATGSGGTLGLNLVDDDSIQDGAGNKLGGNGTSGAGDGSFTGQTYTIDKTAPTVSSINRSGSSPTNAGSVSWTVTFSESVSGVDSGDFALVGAGATGASISTVSGSGASYTVTAATGSDGALGLNLVDNDSIQDSASNKLGGSGTGNGNLSGQTYTVDKTQPTVTTISRHSASPTNASSVQWDVTFSESVTGVTASNFTLVNSGLGGSPAITNVAGSGTSWTVTASTGSGNGTLGLNQTNGTGVSDAAGNGLSGTFTGAVYTIDRTAPIVQSIARVGSSPTNASSVQWTVTFSESVSGVSASNFTLVNSGLGGTPAISTVSGSGTTWTVTASTGSGDGTLGLNQSSGTGVSDAAGNGLSGTFTGAVYTIDHTAPTVTAAIANTTTSTSGFLKQGDGYYVYANATDSGSGVNGTTITASGLGGISGSGQNCKDLSGNTVNCNSVPLSSTGGPFTVNIPGDGTTTYTYRSFQQTAQASITDGSVKSFTVQATDNTTNNGSSSASVTIDNTAPTVTVNQAATQGDPTKTLPIHFTATFSEAVSGFASGDVTLGGTATRTSATVTLSQTDATHYDISVAGLSSDGTLTASIAAAAVTDYAGNGTSASTSSDNTVTYDTTAPALSTLQMFDTDSDGKIDQVKATFNETLNSSYSAPNTVWTLANAPGGATLASVSVSGAVATLTLNEGTVTTAAGSFTIALAADANGVRDAAGNLSSFAATAVTDKARPVLTTLEMFDSNTNGKIDQVKATFSETLSTPYSAANSIWTLANVPGGATLASVSVSNSVATLTLTEGTVNTAAGSFTVALTADANGIRDAAGNQSSFSATPVADKAGPVPTSFASANGSTTTGKAESNDTITVTFSEPILASSIPLPGGTSNVSLNAQSGSNKTVTLTLPGLASIGFGIGTDGTGGYMNAAGTATFTSSPFSQPTSSQVRITLASSCTGTGCSNLSTGGAVSFTFVPASNLTDAAGNVATGSLAVGPITLF